VTTCLVCIWVPFKRRRHTRFMDCGDSSERVALLNTSEETGQARDTSTHVIFNVLNSTSSPQILDSLFLSFFLCFYAAQWTWGRIRKKRIFKSAVKNKTSKLNFLVRDKISSIIPGCWYLPHLSVAPTPLEKWSRRARMGAPEHGAGRASSRPHRMRIPFRACIGSSCLRCRHTAFPSIDQVVCRMAELLK